jgi:hypothetical protein
MAMESKSNFYEINGVAAASIEPQLSLGSFLVEYSKIWRDIIIGA